MTDFHAGRCIPGRYFHHYQWVDSYPEDMGNAYLFLAFKEAGFISGHTLPANVVPCPCSRIAKGTLGNREVPDSYSLN